METEQPSGQVDIGVEGDLGAPETVGVGEAVEQIPEVTPFDNQITMLYKWAHYLGQPIRYLVLPLESQVGNATTLTGLQPAALISIIQQMIDANWPFSLIVTNLHTNYRITANDNDIAMIYFGLVGVNQATQEQALNDLNQSLRQGGFRDLEELALSYGAWSDRFQRRLDRDRQVLSGILDIQQTLLGLTPLHVSPVEVNHVVVAVDPVISTTNRSVDIADGIDIFNAAVTSNIIPYIQYNDGDGTKFYKVYEGSTTTPVPDYSVVIQPTTQTNRRNTIYMTVWSGVGDVAKASKESFMRAIWSLETNRLIVNAPVNLANGQNEAMMIERISASLPSLTLGPIHEVRVGGDFLIYDVEINDTSLLDAILIQPLMNTYLYIEEWTKPYAEKKRLYIHYKALAGDNDPLNAAQESDILGPDAEGGSSTAMTSSMSVSLNQRYSGPDETFSADLGTPTPTTFALSQGTPYLHVNILRANDRNIIQQFITIVRRLFQFYKQIRPEIDETYQAFIPGLTRIENAQRQSRMQESIGGNTGVGMPTQRKGKGRGAVKGKSENTVTVPNVTTQDGFVLPRATGSMSKIDQLQDLAPDLIVSGYARKCQCPHQPQIIGPNDVDVWRQRRFVMKGVLQERQILPFPRENPRWLFVCPSDTFPYPGVRDNDLSNKEIYPYIPCCFGADQMDPTKPNLGYNHYYRDMVSQTKSKSNTKSNHTFRTNKVPAPGRVGFVSKSISDLLRRYSETAVDIVRYGIVHSPNSLIHCVCLATDNPQYKSLLNNPDAELGQANAEAFALAVRRQIATTTIPGLLRQEMYDYTDTEIRNHLADPARFLDPFYYYRAVEELFGINIFTFTLPREVGVTGSTDITGELGSIEVPRFRLFRSQPIRPERRTVVILKYWGSESSHLLYPHCELLVDYDKDNDIVTSIFGPEMTKICHDAILDVSRAITWSFALDLSQIPIVVARDNLYSWIDMGSILGRSGVIPTGQVIDAYGKLRAIQCRQNSTGISLFVICLPGQPLNLPEIDPSNGYGVVAGPVTGPVTGVRSSGRSEPIPVVDSRTAISIFGAPTSTVRSKETGQLEGLWFQLFDVASGVMVPVLHTEAWNQLPEGPPNPISVKGVDPVRRLKLLRRSAELLLQLLVWLFLIAQRQNIRVSVEQNPDQPVTVLTGNAFAQQYMAIGSPPLDTSTYYDFSRLPRRLPDVETVELGIRYMQTYVPTLFAQGRIIMYSPQLAGKLVEKLNEYQRNLLAPDTIIPLEVRGLYREAIDFNPQPSTAILVGERDLQGWLRSLSRPGVKNMIVRDRLDLAFGVSDEPYLYALPDPTTDVVRMYMIQNVLSGDRNRALHVAKTWYLDKVNLGFQADLPSLDVEMPVHVIFGISTAATPIPMEDLSGGNTSYLELLTYGSNQYAAMLPML
jgi:hypothetical protein